MPYKNIVFIKLEKRLLNDHRWYLLSEAAQLIYIKIILLAAETYNKIPKDEGILKLALRSSLEPSEIKKCLEEIQNNFPKFKLNHSHYYFSEFDEKTNYRHQKGYPKENPGISQGVARVGVEKKRKEKNKKRKEGALSSREDYLKPENIKNLKTLFKDTQSLKNHLLNLAFSEAEIDKAIGKNF